MRWVNRERLVELIEHVRNNPHSRFYAAKYAGLPFDEENFFNLPYLTREELVATPVMERLYVSQREVRFVAFTSGTSARVPLITPFSDVENYFFEPSLGLSVARPLIIYPPLNKNFGHTFIEQCREARAPVSPVFADYQNLRNSAVLARMLGCDSLYATPTIALLFAEHARACNIEQSFKLLALSSETLSRARREELCVAYPNARVANLYASSEIGQFALVPCPRMIERGENHFHIIADALAAVELYEGELVVSYGLNRACPLLRYRTGDHFEEVEGGCPCGLPGPVLAWSHRAEVDRVRLNGVEFDVESADRAMGSLRELVRPHYQVHFREGKSGMQIEVEVEEPRLAAHKERAALGERLARELALAWRISSGASVKDALARGLFSSLSMNFVSTLSAQGLKTKRFVNHTHE